MSVDCNLIALTVKFKMLSDVQQAGVSSDDFVDEYRNVWRYILKTYKEHGSIPSKQVLSSRFPDLQYPMVRRTDMPMLIHDIKQRRKFIELLKALNNTASTVNTPEEVDGAIQELVSRLNSIGFSGKQKSHLVDLFSAEVSTAMQTEIKDRRSGKSMGIQTGFQRFDRIAGGLHKQKMVTIIGRPGIGKSWLDLMFVASAVIGGHKVILYPLEMNLQETAFRLYTLFTQKIFGAERVLKNHDLTMGNVNMRRVQRLFAALEDKYAGQLYVADVSSLADPYTNERIEAEVDIHKPDMFWVDYLTLLKPPAGKSVNDDGWGAVRSLSNGIKNTAMRRDCVGGCSAQVNREAMRTNAFLPRLEHIAYGDSIGQDADLVFSVNRDPKSRAEWLYYSLVKNRGGAEIGKTKVRFNVNEGVLAEVERDQEEDGDDDEE